MRELLREKQCTNVFVLDTGALFSSFPFYVSDCLVTTVQVRDEVKDSENYEKLLLAIETKGVIIVSPPIIDLKLDKIYEEKLSEADKSVLRLGLSLKENSFQVIIVTDDYMLQKAAQRLGLKFIPIKTLGISRLSDLK